AIRTMPAMMRTAEIAAQMGSSFFLVIFHFLPFEVAERALALGRTHHDCPAEAVDNERADTREHDRKAEDKRGDLQRADGDRRHKEGNDGKHNMQIEELPEALSVSRL